MPDVPREETVLAGITEFWDADAPTYDDSDNHRPRNPAVLAAWAGTLARLLPPAPCRVLDAGAGTGFLSLAAARLGHRVTALDVSAQMLERLRASAESEGLEVEIAVGAAHEPPDGFDVVMERHLVWTLPDPGRTLAAWHAAAPNGRLLLIESIWGCAADPGEAVRGRLRHGLSRLRSEPPHHHGSYSDTLRESLPFGRGTPPAAVVQLAADAGWPSPRLERLADVEWAERTELGPLDRLLGVPPRFCVLSG